MKLAPYIASYAKKKVVLGTVIALLCLFYNGYASAREYTVIQLQFNHTHSTTYIGSVNGFSLTELLLEHTSYNFKQQLNTVFKSFSKSIFKPSEHKQSKKIPNSASQKDQKSLEFQIKSQSASFEVLEIMDASCIPTTLQLDSNGLATLLPSDIDNGSTTPSGTPILSLSKESFDCSNIGSNDVTLTVTDEDGNSTECTTTVTVEDNFDPTAICQNITVQLDAAGNAAITADDIDNGSSDACGIASRTLDISTFDCSNIGANTVTLTVTDNNGNIASCTSTVTVADSVAPTAICQPITVQLDATGNASITADDIDNGSSDACGIASRTLDISTIDCSNLGANTVTLTVTDNNGNSTSCTSTVTVADTVAPTAICQPITVQLDASGNAAITADDIDNGSSDACGIASRTLDISTFDCSDIGTNTVTLTVTDNNGNIASCTSTVTVADSVAPTAICQPITVQLDATGNASITASDIDNGSSDACGIAWRTLDISTFDCSNLGANTVILTVTDNNGNSTSCTSTVTVADSVAPTAICENITVQLDASGNASFTASDIDNGSSDACGIASRTLDVSTFDCSNLGANTVTLTLTDNNGNISSCTSTVTVVDNVAPTAICQNITVQLDASGNTSITAADIDNGSSDACGIASRTLDVSTFDCSNIGTNTVTLTVTDNNGNIASCTSTVTVADTVAPTAICQPITVQLDASGNAAITADHIDNGSSDACGIASRTLDISTFNCSDIGTNTVTLTVTDNNGNSTSCTSTVTVTDSVAPTAICENITVQLDAAGNAVITANDIDNGSSDACGIESRSLDVSTFDCTNVGTNMVTLTVTDNNGNRASCTSTVTVVDNVAPIVTCKNITVQLDASGNASISAGDIINSSNDSCGIASRTLDVSTFDCSNIGANTVTLTVTDNSGNSTSCTSTVTVADSVAPSANCQNITVQLDAAGNASIVPADIDNGSNDACGIASRTMDVSTFDCSDIGNKNVTLTVTDTNGNSSSCVAIVTVEDNIAPNVICKNITVQLDNNGIGSITANDINNGSNDACGIASMSIDISSFDCTDIGIRNVILTVNDNNGNSTNCLAQVTVEDNIPPDQPTLGSITWGCDYTPPIPSTTSNCTNGMINGVSNVEFPITETTTIIWTFTDENGNSVTSQQTIIIDSLTGIPNVLQNVSCNGGMDGRVSISGQGGSAPYTYDWNGLDPNALPAGTHAVKITDVNGCTSTSNFTITEPSQLTASISNQVNNACYGNNVGSVTVAGANGTPGYRYSLDGGTFRSSGSFSGLTAGDYVVTVRDAKLCTVDQNITITEPSDPVRAVIQITDEGCSTIGTKGVIVTATGGTNSAFEYRRHNGSWGSWTSNGNFGPQPDGDYLFEARDAAGCASNIESVKIEYSNPLNLSIPTKQDVICYGESTGSANSSPTGGLPPYSYSWNTSPVQTSANATGLSAGSYTLTVTDGNGCSISQNVSISQPTEIQVAETHTDVNCYGNNTGSISLTATGGKPNYQYNINNGSYGSNSNFANLGAGTYIMGVLDSNGCEKQIEVTIDQPEILSSTYTLGTDGCAGSSNGTATVNISGGTSPYNYSWNTSSTQTTATATGLSPGNYICTVTDQNGCILNVNVNYVDPPVLNVTTSTTVTSGVGQSDGRATVSASGGGGTYSYSWNTSPIQTTPTATGLTQGSYTVTVTDNLGCSTTASVVVADKIIISQFIEELNYEIGCTEGDNIEQLTLRPDITGGYGTLTYSWSYGANASVISGDNNGGSKVLSYSVGGTKNISVTVTDASGQSVTATFSVIIDSCITFDVDCTKCVANDYNLGEYYIGDADGNPIGTCDNPGEVISSPIYIWFYLNHNDNTNYSLTVVAEYATTHPITGEVKIETIQDCLYEGVPIGLGRANLFIDTDYVCGSTIEISNFLISWNKLARTPCRQDAPKCLCIADVLTIDSPLSGNLIETDISCNNGNPNGSIDLSLFGGTPPFTYSWTTADGSGLSPNAANQTGLSEGTYTVSVTDSKVSYNETTKTYYSDPQTITLSATISKPPLLVIASTSVVQPLCSGDSNGSASVVASGGTPDYTYSWNSSPVQTTQTATNLTAGDYIVTVTDANGCSTSETVTISEPEPLSASIVYNEPLCFGNSNGSATVTVSGGVGGYTYSWNTSPVKTGQTANNLRAGSYTVTILDSNNCSTSATVTISQPTQLTATVSKTNINCFDAANGTATVTAAGGTGAYTYLWNDPSSQTTQTATNLAPGTYNVIVRDQNNCQVSRNVTITQPTELTVSVDYENPECYTLITATANPTGGTGQFTYAWNTTPVQTTQTANFILSGNYTVTVTDQNGCTAFQSIDVAIPLLTSANAGPDQNLSNTNCGITSVTLSGSGTDTGGNSYSGTWSIVSGSGGSLGNPTDPNTTFTGQSGQTYVLRYSISCAQDDVQIHFPIACSKLDFDGTNDYVDFGNNHNFNSDFSIELWIKSEATNSNTQTILSKRNANDLVNGYDLRLVNNTLSFNWNVSNISSPYKISSNRWYHVAITFDGTNYSIYIDGVLANTKTGSSPTSNTNKLLLGAMDRNQSSPNNYYNGWMDELRIWNKQLSIEHIRHMMNQEIQQNGSNVRGEIIPIDIPGLLWSDLDSYYQMKQPSDIGNGNLLDNKASLDGRLYNITTWQDDTAPLPYLTKRNGVWNITNSTTPWLHGDGVWAYPNAIGINNTPIDWNIVQTSHDVRLNSQDVVLLGLLVDSQKITVTNSGTQDETNQGHGLTVTHYLKLDGMIDLIGESQLVQKRYTASQIIESILDAASTGYIKRDQQGTTNKYNYNYWGSPTGTMGSGSNNTPFNVGAILYDGTYTTNPVPVSWNSTYDATGSTNPVNLSKRWIYIYENFPIDTYAAWKYTGETGMIPVGLAFTMKGSAVGDPVNDRQNYSFMGKPNNSTITTTISIGNQALVGNPYPSAIDANEFIKDNIPGATGNPGTNGSIDGSLYFWEHYQSNFTHILRDYQGGYAIYNLSGGLQAISPPLVSGEGTSTKIPGQYIPVAQGFFVTSSDNGGTVSFKNRQRIFQRESVTNSTFFRVRNPGTSEQSSGNDNVKRVRLSFLTPEKATRPLLLSFMGDENATDGFDYGYDALINNKDLPNDMSWMIEKNRYLIQGVGNYEIDKQYPLGIFLTNAGKIKIRLDKLENFEATDKVYLHDMETGTYFEINNNDFEIALDAGEYVNRFYVTFQTDQSLSEKDDYIENPIVVNYLNNSKEIYIKSPSSVIIKQVYLINVLGQTVKSWNAFNANLLSETKIPVGKVADGNYIIKLETNGASFNKKVIIKQ